MKLVRVIIVCLALMGATPALQACPMCQEAAGSSQTDKDDAYYQARAFNHAIYLMVSMPYLLLAGVGFLIYRSVRQSRVVDITAPEDL